MKPILFTTESVKAILEGRKTQTRRVIKPQPPKGASKASQSILTGEWDIYIPDGIGYIMKPKHLLNEILWVREAWVWDGDTKYTDLSPIGNFFYKADFDDGEGPIKWKPSIFMPHEAARIFLEVTDVRAEILQDISEEDAICEGILQPDNIGDAQWFDPITNYRKIWQSINAKKHPWESNPWVWVYTFKQIEKP